MVVRVAAPLVAPVRTTQLLTNDPTRRRHAIADRLVSLIDATPAGEQIDVVTYYIESERLASALRSAITRGVSVHVILAGDPLSRRMLVGGRLIRFIRHHPDDGSWAQRSHGSARGGGGLMHEKTWRFSRSGDQRWIVVTGSYNPSPRSDDFGYSHMVQVAWDRAIYDEFATIYREQHRQRRSAKPLVQAGGKGWSAYFMPMNRAQASGDPVMARLSAIPADPTTTIKIEMYSMWGPRGIWIQRRLVAMARQGARITLLAGPWVSSSIQDDLQRGGVQVESACFADGTYTHAKEMAATWTARGSRVWWTWVGSDNWTSGGTADDEAVLGLQGRNPYADYSKAFDAVRQRAGVPTSSCAAVLD
ncbi:MAG: hypothetical protein JWQ74_61 [Marmoricola sp.]|nr:hypothetical protein [Marmoricola sp.]